jgi:hypothetical protein
MRISILLIIATSHLIWGKFWEARAYQEIGDCTSLLSNFVLEVQQRPDSFSYPTLYFNGIVARNQTGQILFAYGEPLIKHADLVHLIGMKTPGEVREILWAGELAMRGGIIILANETAGIRQEKPHLFSEHASTNNFLEVSQQFWALKKLLGTNFRGLPYHRGHEHLAPILRDASKLRHDLVKFLYNVWIQHYLFSMNTVDRPEAKKIVLQNVKESLEHMALLENGGILLEVCRQQLQTLKTFLQRIDHTQDLISDTEMEVYHLTLSQLQQGLLEGFHRIILLKHEAIPSSNVIFPWPVSTEPFTSTSFTSSSLTF